MLLNMVVVGTKFYILSDIGRIEEVMLFTHYHESIYQVTTVDDASRHDDNRTGDSCTLTVKHALSVLTMDHRVPHNV